MELSLIALDEALQQIERLTKEMKVVKEKLAILEERQGLNVVNSDDEIQGDA